MNDQKKPPGFFGRQASQTNRSQTVPPRKLNPNETKKVYFGFHVSKTTFPHLHGQGVIKHSENLNTTKNNKTIIQGFCAIVGIRNERFFIFTKSFSKNVGRKFKLLSTSFYGRNEIWTIFSANKGK